MTIRALIVGEAYGTTEAALRHPFVGASGLELARMAAAVDLGPPLRSEYSSGPELIRHWRAAEADYSLRLSNVFSEQPPGNNVLHFFDKDGNRDLPVFSAGSRKGYVKPEFMPHVLRLWDEIRTLRPTIVIAMGNAACWALVGQTKITALRGAVQWSKRLEVKVLPTFHPAAILRQWSMRPITLADLRKAKDESAFAEIRRPERWLTIPEPTVEGLDEVASWLAAPTAHYAIDIETAFGQISIVGFARDAHHGLVIPFHRPNGDSFWPEPRLEVEAWKSVMLGLKRPVPKVFQNGLYDISYFLRLGLVPTRCEDDTMLRHHSRYPELPKALGFLASLYSREVAWKTMRRVESLKRDE